MDDMWTWKDPRIVQCWWKCRTLFWKAVLMRRRNLIISIFEILIPVICAIQIRLIFEPLALHIQDIDTHNGQDILSNIPEETNYRYSPRNHFFDALMDQVSTIIQRPILPAIDEEELVTTFYAKNKSKTSGHVVWVIFQKNISKSASHPEVLNYKIRMKMPGGFDNDADIYMSGGFMVMQMAVESSFIKMWNSKDSYFTGENVTIGQFPFYRIHFPMLPSTVRPNISLIYYLTLIGFLLIPMTTLHKAIHDKTTGFKALLRMLRYHPGLMYLGWIDYLLITAIPATIISTYILSPIYSNSGAFVLGIFFMMYITMSTIFILAIGTFFMHSMKAVLACFIFWIFLAHATIVLDESIINSGLVIKAASLCLPHSGLLYGLAALTSRSEIDDFRVEKSLISDLGYRTIEITENKDRVTIGLVLLFWTFHIIAWYKIGVYLENIFPGKCGTPKPWYYPCKAKSKPSDIFVTFRGSTNWSAVERAPKFVQAKVRVRRVTMKYGIAERLEVLRDMSIDFYPNEFSVILGHNGAGKSSLLKIMTGMYKASHGKIYIEGRDYSDDEWSEYQKKSSISYCPQENILVNYLTTFEHVHLFAMMKSMSFREAKKQALILLKELGLENEKNHMIEKLTFSGKRRLCLAMALIGESEVLVLDEPAYGLDPQHRKRVWQVLSTFKGKKTIIMATNSMEAADTLADRIAIIATGRIECCGSKSFLNRRYGIGYDLKLTIKPDCDIEVLQSSIQEYSPHQITFRGTLGMIARFNVPKSSRFPKLLSFLELKKEELMIKCFSLSPPSIEGQFIRIGLSSHFRERGVSFPMNQYELIVQQRRRELIQSGTNWIRLCNATLYRQQIAAMLYKKWLYVISSWKMYLFSMIFSIMTLIFTMMVGDFAKHPHFNSFEINLNVTRYTSRNFLMLYHYSSVDSDALGFFKSLKSVTKLYGKDNFHVTNNITATEVMIHPNLHSIHLRDRYFISMDILPDNQVKIMHSPIAIDSGPIALNLFHNSLLKYSTNNDNLRINLKSQPLIDPRDWQQRIVHQKSVKSWENAVIIITLFLILPTIELGIIEAKSLTKQLQFNTRGITPLMYWMPIYLVDLMIYVLSLLIISSASFALHPHKNSISNINIAQSFLILFAYGTAAIHMGYCIQIFIHRRGTVYLSVLAINFFSILAMNPTILFPVFLRWLSKPLRILMEVILHGIPAYALACSTGNYIGINLYNSQCMAENNCENEFGIEDPCCQNCGNDICYIPLNELLDSQSGSMFVHSVIIDVVIMFLQAISFHFILHVFESKGHKKVKIVEIPETDNQSPEDLERIQDESAVERQEKEIPKEILINNPVQDNEDEFLTSEIAVTVENLSQNYGKNDIIHDINFKINKGQCFGLLGMNGAGKSTVVRVLTGQLPINTGRAIVYNLDMSSNPDKVLGIIGYCPQNNGLFEFMTARQNLRFFAAIRGVPRKFIEEEIDKWLDVSDLLEFENINIKNCAWGIKRKVCLLQSIIGNPLVIILDEPASGMDVITRNALVETLHQVKEMGSTLCLTTHSTEEAEALCDYLGILVDGKMVKTGCSEEVKKTFGDKISMKIILDQEVEDESVEAIKMSVGQVFPSAEFIHQHQYWLSYELDDRISYTEIYEELEKLKRTHLNVTDYFVNQQSLGQVFHKLTNVESFQKIEKSFFQRIFTELMNIFAQK